jgi:small subunit ribosomal protein S6
MHKYEVMVILDSDIEERTVGTSLDKFLNVIRNGGGTVDSVDIWGRRSFAYEINKKTEGIYAVLYLTCKPAEVLELDRQLTLSEAVVRTKVLRAEDAVFRINPVVVPEVKASEDKPARAKKAPAAKSAE